MFEQSFLTLDKIKNGENFLITKILDPQIKCLSTRMGMDEGQHMQCIYRTPHGPVILRKKFQEIALGNNLTRKIQIRLV